MVQKPEIDKKSAIFSLKEFFDSTAFGFMPNQFINVLFYSILLLSGLGWWIVALVNSLKHIGSYVSELFLGNYDNKTLLSRIRLFSLFYAFSFFIMIFGLVYNNYMIFGIGMIFSGISISSQGLLYRRLVKQELKFSYLREYYSRINFFTLLSVALTFVSAYLFLRVNSLIIPLEIASISFILSSYILFRLKPEKKIKELSQITGFRKLVSEYKNIKVFSKRTIFILALAIINATIILTYSYLGIYIFEQYKHFYLGHFGNIALVFGISIIASLLFSKKINYLISNNYGQLPVIIFGISLFSLIPLSYSQSVDFISLIIATSVGLMGMSMLRISSEIYMIRNNFKSKLNGIAFSKILLLMLISLYFYQNYTNYFMFLFYSAIVSLILFFGILIFEQRLTK